MRKLRLKKPVSKSISYKALFFLPIVLALAGSIMVLEASSIRSIAEFGYSYHYLKLQLIWIGLGVLAMLFFSFFNYKHLYLFALPLIVITMFLLIVVLVPSIGAKAGGARRWIDLGFFNLQPTEFAKLATIIYLASWFSVRERKRFFSFIFLLGALIGLILLQPDMGTAFIIYSLGLIIYFLAGDELQYLVTVIPLSAAGFLLMIKLAPYRFARFMAFLNPNEDTQGISYHINQILISLSHGGLTGRGFGASRQKYLFLPEAHTDSIFAIIGEEFGLIGGVVLIFVYFILLYKLYILYLQTSDRFGKLLVGGILTFFGMQIITNLAGMVNLIPLTGVPLPFISYGGSHIMTSFMLLGIAINISRKKR